MKKRITPAIRCFRMFFMKRMSEQERSASVLVSSSPFKRAQ
jgi:hypothetical protein